MAHPSSTAFHWLNFSKDATLFEHIKTAFADELKPDDPEKVKPVVAQEYKWISRVGVFETSALVLIGERETRTSTYRNYFVAFNYDLKSGEKTSLTSFNKGFIEWKFKKLIRFDSLFNTYTRRLRTDWRRKPHQRKQNDQCIDSQCGPKRNFRD